MNTVKSLQIIIIIWYCTYIQTISRVLDFLATFFVLHELLNELRG